MSNTGFIFSPVNQVRARQDWVLTLPPFVTGQTVTVGSLDDLRDPRLSTRCTIQNSRVGAGTVSVEIWFEQQEGGPPLDLGVFGLLNCEVNAPGASSVVMGGDVFGDEGTGLLPNVGDWQRPTEDFPKHLWAFAPDRRTDLTRLRLWVTATFGSGGGTLTLTAGGLWAGPAWTPPLGIESSWRCTVVDPGTMARSAGGQGYPRRRQRWRQFEAQLTHVPLEWAYGAADGSILDVQQLLYTIGATEPVAVFFRTRDAAGALSPHLQHRLGVYGHLSDRGSIRHLGGDYYAWDFRVDELL